MRTLIIETVLYLLFALPASFVDVRKFRIPFYYILGGIFVFLALNIVRALQTFSFAEKLFWENIVYILLSMISSALLFGLARLLSAGGLGKGDILFAVFTSLYCRFYENLIAAVFAALSGILFYLFLRIYQKKLKRRNVAYPVFAIPFVPFISFGALLDKFLFHILPFI